MIERVDDIDRLVRLAVPAQRIVCLVPSITESIFALGQDSESPGQAGHMSTLTISPSHS